MGYDELLNEKNVPMVEDQIESCEEQQQQQMQYDGSTLVSNNNDNNNNTKEFENMFQSQDQQIKDLVAQICILKKDDIVHVHTLSTSFTDSHNEDNDNNNSGNNSSSNGSNEEEIVPMQQELKSLEVNNAAKYAEISKLEEELATLREEQNTRKVQATSVLEI